MRLSFVLRIECCFAIHASEAVFGTVLEASDVHALLVRHCEHLTITDGPAHNLATFAAHVSTEDRAHRIARDASDAETHFCGHIANSEACHDSFAEGCTLSQKPNTYDAYLNYFKNLTPSPDSAASQAVHTPLTSLEDFQKFDHATIELGLGKKRQVNFSPDLADIGEGNIYRVIGYLYYAIPGGIETSNCKLIDVDYRDYHIGIGFDPDMANDIANGTITISKKDTDTDPIKQASVIVEMTPHYRTQFHENWTLPRVQQLAGRQVKVVGQLIVDNEHNDAGQNCAFPNHDESSCWRASTWEIHPVTNFYICKTQNCSANSDAGWVELDDWSEN